MVSGNSEKVNGDADGVRTGSVRVRFKVDGTDDDL